MGAVAGNAHGNGLNFGGAKAQSIDRELARLRRENATRQQCAHCDLRILPDQMSRHVVICHTED